MYQPEGFEKDATSVCRLLKSLYGLKQSARNWQNLLVQMFNEEFFPLMADPCVFFLKEADGWCMCSTHVDDIFCLFNQPGKTLRDRLFAKIQTYVQMENLGPVSWALQTTILRDRAAGIIKITQERYTQEYLNRGDFLKNDAVATRASGDGQMIHSKKTPNFFASGKEKLSDDSYDRVNENLKNGCGTMVACTNFTPGHIFLGPPLCKNGPPADKKIGTFHQNNQRLFGRNYVNRNYIPAKSNPPQSFRIRGCGLCI